MFLETRIKVLDELTNQQPCHLESTTILAVLVLSQRATDAVKETVNRTE